MTVLIIIVSGVLMGFGTAALIGLTAPWWIPTVDPLMERWADWVDRKIEARKEAR